MSNCRDKEIQLACFKPSDGSPSVTINHTIIYDSDGVPIATYFSDREGVVIDETSYLGGGEATLGDCVESQLECVESQEWTYALDNTGTSFAVDNTIELTLSDGTTITFFQPATTGWTPQMQDWADKIQAEADAAGLRWFAETRFRNPSNPADLSGGGSFSGPPSLPVSNALTSMLWRYVNIQICPGQPTPVSARIVESSNAIYNDRALTTDGPVKGPLQRFFVCRNCGDEPVWYLDDNETLAEEGQIPDCFEPCGVISQLPAPPENDCTFEIDVACDNNNSQNTADFTNTITRRAKVCNGEQIAVDYFESDPNDPNALIPYTLVGDFVDCASGEPIDLPPQPCSNTTYAGTLWRLKPNATRETTVDWWSTATFPAGQTSAPHGNVSDIFTVSTDGRTLEHVNGQPAVTFTTTLSNIVTSSGSFLDAVGASSNAETSGNDQLRVRGYVALNAPALLKDTNTNTGERGGIWINRCCAGKLELLFEDTTDSVGGDTGIFDGVVVPEGIHYFEAVTSDVSAWQGFELSASLDDGATYQPLDIYSSKPIYECISMLRCNDSELLINAVSGEVIDVQESDLFCEPPVCDRCCEGNKEAESNNTGSSPTAEEIADAIVRKQRDVTPQVLNVLNSNAIIDLGLPAGTFGRIVSIEDIGTGLVRWTIDGSVPANGNGFITTGPYHSSYNLQNVDLSLVRIQGSSAAADYSVAYEIYN